MGNLDVVLNEKLFMTRLWDKEERNMVCAIGEDTVDSSYCVGPTYNVVDERLTWSAREVLVDEE